MDEGADGGRPSTDCLPGCGGDQDADCWIVTAGDLGLRCSQSPRSDHAEMGIERKRSVVGGFEIDQEVFAMGANLRDGHSRTGPVPFQRAGPKRLDGVASQRWSEELLDSMYRVPFWHHGEV